MPEDKREFLILMEEQSYLMKSFESTFEKENVKAKVVSIAMATTLTTKEQPQGYLICTSAELLKKAVGIKVIVDHAIKHKTPVFVMGNVEELEKLWETLPKQMFTDIFIRPINVVEMVENIKKQVLEESKKLNAGDGQKAEMLAWYKWVTEEIRKCGGISIFAVLLRK